MRLPMERGEGRGGRGAGGGEGRKEEKRGKKWGMGPLVSRDQEEEAEAAKNLRRSYQESGEKPEECGIIEAKSRKC